MEKKWLSILLRNKAFIWFLVPLCCGLIAAFLAYREFMPPVGALTAERLYNRDIRARVGPYAPYAYMNKAGMLGGYVMDLTFAIGRAMGVRVMVRSRKLDSLESILARHDAPLVLCLVKTPTTSAVFDFTPPYAIHTYSLFARKDAPPVANYKTLMRRSSFVINTDGPYYDLHPQLFAGRVPGCVLVDTAEEAMQKLVTGECQYTIMETYIGSYFLENPLMKDIRLVQELKEQVEYCFAVRKGNPEVLKTFTEGLAYLQKTGEFDRIERQWVEPRFLVSNRALRHIGFYFLCAFFISAAAMTVLFLYFFLLRRQVAERTSALAQEVEERKKAQEDFAASQAQLMQADRMATIGTLVSGVVHEINNPNGVVLINLKFFKKIFEQLRREDVFGRLGGTLETDGYAGQELEEEVEGALDDALHASGHIRDIVDELRNYMRKTPLSCVEEYSLNDVMERALRMLASMLAARGCRLRTRLAQSLPPLYGQPQKIEQVILNLVINACQALEGDGEKTIDVQTGCEARTNEVFFRVSDNGPGIAPEDLSKVRDPFFTTKRDQGGTGLGLSICDAIVAAHHGRMAIASEPGNGASFTVFLPTGKDCPGGKV